MSERGSISVTWTPCLGRWFRDLYWRPLDLLRSSLLRSPRRCQNPCEWTPRLGSAKPIAQRRPKGDLTRCPRAGQSGARATAAPNPGSAAVGAIWITVLRLRPGVLRAGLHQGRRPALTPGQRRRRRRLDEAAVRRWRKERLNAGKKAKRPFGPVTVAKAYRLLHATFNTAVEEDRIVRRNPCRIEGAGKEESAERQTIPLPVVFAIADAVPVRYRVLVLLATFADLRWGELAGLRRENIDLDACEVRIVGTVAEPDK